jgi:hypothetical protein
LWKYHSHFHRLRIGVNFLNDLKKLNAEIKKVFKRIFIFLGLILVVFVIYLASSNRIHDRTMYKWFTLHLFGQHLAQLLLSVLMDFFYTFEAYRCGKTPHEIAIIQTCHSLLGKSKL